MSSIGCVIDVLLKVTVPEASHFRQMLKVSPKAWSTSQRVLENHCSHIMDDLIRKAETALSAKATRSQLLTVNKEKVQPSLTNLMARPGNSSVPLTPPKSPVVHTMKRKMPAEVELKENGSPAKRAKGGPAYVPSGLGLVVSIHTPKARRINAAATLPTPPKSAVLHKEEESENEASNETIVVRSTRSSQKRLDCSAWDLQKPLQKLVATTVGAQAPTPSSSPVGLVAFDNTPTTSTGMSDTSSPTLPIRSRAAVQARVHVPLTAKGLSYPSQEEEMPRRRRRNLRAAFLNPGVYGWKPAGHAAKNLERARNWETLMIGKYGDPWDAS